MSKKAAGERLSMVAIADFMTAAWAWRAGIDIVGVGDSMGMTMYGHENTLDCTVEQMIEHTSAARRGAPDTFCITAMPYGSYATEEIAVVNADSASRAAQSGSARAPGQPFSRSVGQGRRSPGGGAAGASAMLIEPNRATPYSARAWMKTMMPAISSISSTVWRAT